jgi:hypothetical protein
MTDSSEAHDPFSVLTLYRAFTEHEQLNAKGCKTGIAIHYPKLRQNDTKKRRKLLAITMD